MFFMRRERKCVFFRSPMKRQMGKMYRWRKKKTFDVSYNGKLLRWVCFVFSAFFAVGASYADNIDNQDYVLSGAMDFIAEAGVTDDYTE